MQAPAFSDTPERTFQILGVHVSDTDRKGLWPEQARQMKSARRGTPDPRSVAMVLSGRTLAGESILVTIRGFVSTFHVRVPESQRAAARGVDCLPPALEALRAQIASATCEFGTLGVERATPFGHYAEAELFFVVSARTDFHGRLAQQAVLDLGLGVEIVAPGRVFLRETVLFHDLGWEFSSLLALSPDTPQRLQPNGVARRGRCVLEFLLDVADVRAGWLRPAVDQLSTAPLVVASVDLEVEAPGGGFPDALLPQDRIVCIGVHSAVVGDPASAQDVVLCLDERRTGWGDAPVGRFECHPTERDLIDAYAALVETLDVDVFIGYNLLGFDDEYLWRRAQLVGAHRIESYGRLRGLDNELREIELSSSALGDNVFHEIYSSGRITLDMMHYVKPNYKLPSYTLDYVAKKLLRAQPGEAAAEGKHDMHYSLITTFASGASDAEIAERCSEDLQAALLLRRFPPADHARVHRLLTPETRAADMQNMASELYAEHRAAVTQLLLAPDDCFFLKTGDDAGARRRALLADYCRQDCVLPMRLMNELGALPSLLAMSRVTHTSLYNILRKGQQIKVFSTLYRATRARGFVMTQPPRDYCELQGATVLDPVRGVHTRPVATLDFASLYPNCFRWGNLCYCTYVGMRDVSEPAPAAVPDADRRDVLISERTAVAFVRPHVRRGVLPEVVGELLAARKATRRRMQTLDEASAEYTNLDKRQMALKVSANSMYGVLAVDKGAYSLYPVAASTTALGRLALSVTQRLCLQEFAHVVRRIIYGDTDSVMVELNVPDDVWRAEVPQKCLQDGGSKIRLESTVGVRAAFEMGRALEAALNSRLAEEMRTEYLVIEFEQLFDVSCFLSPKRYFGSRWTGPDRSDGVYFKGVQSERRDACEPQREAMRGAMAALLYGDAADPVRRVEGAVHAVQAVLQRVVDHQVPFASYVMSKSRRAHYKKPNAQMPHLKVCRELKRVAAGLEPKPGNRVPYVVCYDGCRGSSVTERAVDPDMALASDRRPDRAFYVGLVCTGIGGLLDPLLPGAQTVAEVARPYLARIHAQDAGAVRLTGSASGTTPIPPVRLVAPPTPSRALTQRTLGFAVVRRGAGDGAEGGGEGGDEDAARARRPPPTRAPPSKKRREAPHATLKFGRA